MREWKNQLYYGDNLDVLREHIQPESVDLVYLDPPFNSNATYNVLFSEQDGTRAAAQIKAFEDSWRWDDAASRQLEETVEAGGQVSVALQAFKGLVPQSNMLAYLTMMAPRLVELRRVLKPTGSIYLHCDPTASHYLKLLMDAVFRADNFRNEIIWMRTLAKGLMTRQLPTSHDVILSYQRTGNAVWNIAEAHIPYDLDNLDEKTAGKYSHHDYDGRRYQLDNLINPNPDRPNLTYEFLGVTRVWRWTRDRMEKAYQDGLVVQPKPGAVPRFKRYLDEQRGRSLGDVWVDIPPLNSQAEERLGYPTQKPEALLQRIILTSSNEGDVILDPFCGCGTAIAVAERFKRRWIGIDITYLAVALMKHRLREAFGDSVSSYEVIGEPVTVQDAQALADNADKYPFQYWALGLVGARPTDAERKKGADKGIDGRLYFHDEDKGKTKQIIISVKAGAVGVAHVRDLRGVIERETAVIGVLITMREPTGPMLREAASSGFYAAPDLNNRETKHPRLQILTIREVLEGKGIDYPRHAVNVTLKRAPKAKDEVARHLRLDGVK